MSMQLYRTWDGRDPAANLGQDAKDDEPDATGDARPAGGAPRERDDTVVLCKCGAGERHGDGAKE